MKKVVITQPSEVVELSSIAETTPILVYKNDELIGMIIHGVSVKWQVMMPGGYLEPFFDYKSREEICEDLIKAGYELKIDRKDD